LAVTIQHGSGVEGTRFKMKSLSIRRLLMRAREGDDEAVELLKRRYGITYVRNPSKDMLRTTASEEPNKDTRGIATNGVRPVHHREARRFHIPVKHSGGDTNGDGTGN